MTTEEAIRLLERFQNPEPYEPQITADAYTALQMGIDALKKADWINIEKDLPPSLTYVYALVSGTVSGLECKHTPFVASFAPDDGWSLLLIPDRRGDSWKVEAWKPIKYLE